MKNEITYDQLEELFRNQSEWKNELVHSKILSIKDKIKSIELIISKLNSKDVSTRYISSHMILTFNIQQAKEMLIERILNKDTFNSNGTMTYALWHLNCENSLVSIFEILATQSYESQMLAYNILSEQEFIFTTEDLNKLTKIWNEINSHKNEQNEIEDESYEMIKDAYEGFIEYLS